MKFSENKNIFLRLHTAYSVTLRLFQWLGQPRVSASYPCTSQGHILKKTSQSLLGRVYFHFPVQQHTPLALDIFLEWVLFREVFFIKLLTLASAVRRHAQITLHTATPHVLASPVSPVQVLAASPLSGSVSCWALWRWERETTTAHAPQQLYLRRQGRGGRGGGGARYGGQRRHLFSVITIKPKNPADLQTAPGRKQFSASWVSQLPSGAKRLACYMSIKPVVENAEEHLNAVSLSFINRCPSVQSLNGGGTLEDEGSCFLLCSHLQAGTLLPLQPRRNQGFQVR